MNVTIVGLGDSTTAGTPGFRSPLEAPPSGEGDVTSQYTYWLNRQHPDWMVLNRGMNGERSDQIRARFDRDVRSAAPDVVIVLAGVNDVYGGRPVELVQGDLQWMYDAARDAGIQVVAASVLPFNTATPSQDHEIHRLNEWIRRVAEGDARVAFCDTRAATAHPTDPDRLSDSPDNLHPSAEGYRRMAEALRPVVEGVLMRRIGPRNEGC